MGSGYMYDLRIHEIVKSRYPLEGWRSIGEEENLTKNQVEALARKLGIKRLAIKREQIEKVNKVIAERYPFEGPSLLAKEFGLSEAAVIQRANNNGAIIPKTLRYDKMSSTMTERYDRLDLSIWDPLTSVGAYYLGLIWADGSVQSESPDVAKNRDSHYNVTLGLSGEEDHSVIYQLAQFLGLPSDRVHDIKRYSSNHKQRKELKLSGKRLTDLMINRYGIPPNKSNINPPFPKIPDEFLGDFARGLFDGDGSTGNHYFTSYKFFGSFSFLDEFSDRMKKKLGLIQYSLRIQEAKIKIFSVGHPEEVNKVTSFLYGYPERERNYPFLVRKAKPFFDLFDSKELRGRTAHELKPSYETHRNGTKEILTYQA